MFEDIKEQTAKAVSELCDAAGLHAGDIMVIGCSTSEVAGERIGTHSAADLGEALFSAANAVLSERGVFLAAQCCEHTNRSLIVERACVDKYALEPVNLIPQPKAGGSFGTAAYKGFAHPCAVDKIRAHAGIDIGGTLIGMHLKEVAVPVRLSVQSIGKANIICARTRLRFVGGARAVYDENLM
ncbi:MAG: TIGR01440 family protein [Acutalibacteraceae bacterium]